ncbi:DUF4412 domain-containing protein [bacterium]|nr:DUF4412 domain-containing protein [bacterium]
MKKIIFAFLALISFNVHAQIPTAPWAQQMSAEQEINIPNGPKVTSKIYVDNGKVRVDVNAMGMQMSNITRTDKNLMYIIMHTQKMVTTMPLTQKDTDSAMAFDTKNLKFELVGEGTMEGVQCDKYKLNYATSRPMIFWINKANRTPVVMESEAGDMKIIWRNVVPGPQDASLFEPPAGYQVMNMPSMPGAPSPSTPPVGQ